MMDRLSDSLLAGFEELTEQYYPKVYYHALKSLRSTWDSADVTQNTFVKAYINLSGLRNPDSMGAWLFAICDNEIRMWARGRERLPEVPPVRERKDYSALYAAVDRLTESHRTLIALKYICGYSMRQISALTELDEKKVKSRLFEARKKLSCMLTDNLTDTFTFNKRDGRERLMMKINLMKKGSELISCMSLRTQKKLLEGAKDNAPFHEDVLTELSGLPGGQDFAVDCGGKLSYDELVEILACCDTPTVIRISGGSYTTWGSRDGDGLLGDVAKVSNTGAYVDSVEMIVYVKSITETVEWYSRVLGWSGCGSLEDEEYGYSQIFAYTGDIAKCAGTRFKGLHLRKSNTPRGGSCFVFVKSVEVLYEKVKASGCDKVSVLSDNGWGTHGFSVTDPNGVILEFCEWNED